MLASTIPATTHASAIPGAIVGRSPRNTMPQSAAVIGKSPQNTLARLPFTCQMPVIHSQNEKTLAESPYQSTRFQTLRLRCCMAAMR